MILIAVVAMFFLPCVFGGCCLPEKVSGKVWYPTKNNRTNSFLIDFTKNKMIQRAVSERDGNHFTTKHEKTGTQKILHLVPKYPDEYKHYYTVTDLTTGKVVEYFELLDTCKQSMDMVLADFPRCIPSDATKVEAGSESGDSADFDTWAYQFGLYRKFMKFTMTVNKNTCTPVTALFSFTYPHMDWMAFEFDTNSTQTDMIDLEQMDQEFTNCVDSTTSLIVG